MIEQPAAALPAQEWLLALVADLPLHSAEVHEDWLRTQQETENPAADWQAHVLVLVQLVLVLVQLGSQLRACGASTPGDGMSYK